MPLAVRCMPTEAQRVRRVLVAAFVLLMMLGLLWAPNMEARIGYTLLTLSVLLPCALWIRAGMPGIPIWPVVSVISWLSYALPILRDEQAQMIYTPAAVLLFAATVATFLITATIAWRLMLLSGRGRSSPGVSELVPTSQMAPIVFFGLGSGMLYYLFLFVGTLSFLGSAFGLVRSAMLTCTVVSCYMLGHARGRGVLRGLSWALAVAALMANVLLAWTSLFLVIGITYVLAATAGYVITTKRVPWGSLLGTLLVLTVLHAGKAAVRRQYWVAGSNQVAGLTLTEVPGFLTEWARVGLNTLATGDGGVAVMDRASLYRQLLAVQHLAPVFVPFLYGETYALLPSLLVPRFLAPDKMPSQAGMNMLNVHFGFQTIAETRTTAMGWGLIAEAYANYGFLAVVGIGLLTGMIAGLFSRWSCGTAPISLGSFLGIVAMMTMVDLEADLSYLLTNLWQACVSVVLLLAIWRLLGMQRKRVYPPLRTPRTLA
jgi:hypothetical protein